MRKNNQPHNQPTYRDKHVANRLASITSNTVPSIAPTTNPAIGVSDNPTFTNRSASAVSTTSVSDVWLPTRKGSEGELRIERTTIRSRTPTFAYSLAHPHIHLHRQGRSIDQIIVKPCLQNISKKEEGGRLRGNTTFPCGRRVITVLPPNCMSPTSAPLGRKAPAL